MADTSSSAPPPDDGHPATSTSGQGASGGKDPYGIVHMPRKRAAPPTLKPLDQRRPGQEHLSGPELLEATKKDVDKLLTNDRQVDKAYYVKEENRLGPWLVKYSEY